MSAPIDPRLQPGTEHLHDLGPRAIAEFLRELVGDDRLPEVLELLEGYKGLTREMIAAAGADRFPPKPLHVVPR